MIVHSTANRAADLCAVRVEGIELGTPDALVRLFAQGAAAKHNAGYRVAQSAIQWLEDDGTPIAEGSDTSEATCARVLCRVVEP